MIGWLSGQIINFWQSGQKKGVVISSSGVGYEVQVLSRSIRTKKLSSNLEIWVHNIQREDSSQLYGFFEIEERDLFRKLISVSGVGPQIAMSLLEDCYFAELIEAIKSKDIKKLSKSLGIGKRVAERITIDLSSKLDCFTSLEHKEEYKYNQSKDCKIKLGADHFLEELRQTLSSIGYEESEINMAIDSVILDFKLSQPNTKEVANSKNLPEFDLLLKKALVRLSQNDHKDGT